MEKAKQDQFSFVNLDRYHVLCDLGDEEESNMLFDLYGERFVITGGARRDADLYVVEEAAQADTSFRPLLYFGTEQVPPHTYGINREDEDARAQFEEYLSKVTLSKKQRHELTRRTPFAAIVADDTLSAARAISDIISLNEELDGLGMIAYDHITDEDEICAVIFHADEETMSNEDCISYAREAAQNGLHVLAVLDGDDPQILTEVLPRLWGWCDRNDLWETQAKIEELIGSQQRLQENLYTVKLHLFGVGRPHNYRKGLRMLRRLAQQEHLEALLLLYDCYSVLMVDPPAPDEGDYILERVAHVIQQMGPAETMETLIYKEHLCEEMVDRYLERGKPGMARLIGTQSYTECKRFYGEHEGDREVLSLYAQSANRLAFICSHGEDFRTEVHMYCEYANLQRKLANAQWRQDYDELLLDDLDMLINHGAQLEQSDLVLEALSEAVAWQQLRFARTGAEIDRRRLARYLNLRGNFEMDAGNPSSAHETYATYTQLFTGDQFSDEREMREYATCLSQDADSLLRMDRKEEARREYRRANRVWRSVAENNPDLECLCGLCTTAERYAVCVEGKEDTHIVRMMDIAIDYCDKAGAKAQTPVVWEALAKMFERKADLAEETQERIDYYRKAEEKWQDLYEMTGERYYRGEAVNARKLAQKEARESSGEGGGLFRMFRRKNRAQEEEKAPEAAVMPVSEMPAPPEPARPKFVAPLVGEEPVQEEEQEPETAETVPEEGLPAAADGEDEAPQSEAEEGETGAEEESPEEAEAVTEEESPEEAEAVTEEETPEETEAETEEEIPDETPSEEEETQEEGPETGSQDEEPEDGAPQEETREETGETETSEE